jgi:hypothetical protein
MSSSKVDKSLLHQSTSSSIDLKVAKATVTAELETVTKTTIDTKVNKQLKKRKTSDEFSDNCVYKSKPLRRSKRIEEIVVDLRTTNGSVENNLSSNKVPFPIQQISPLNGTSPAVDDTQNKKQLPTMISSFEPPSVISITESNSTIRRRRKRAVKKLLKSILEYKSLSNRTKRYYLSYINCKFGVFDIEAIRSWFEQEGFLALSFVKNSRMLNEIEKDIVGIFEHVEKRFTKHLINHRERRLINQGSGGKYSVIHTSEDDQRRAVSIAFDHQTKSLQILVEYYVDQFIHLGLIHPDTKVCNASGKLGLELLFKGPGLKSQVDHYDLPQTKNSRLFQSFHHSMDNKLPFNPKLDGGATLFLNHKSTDDYLGCPDGKTIVIPAYSFCILRGNVPHCGTGNDTDEPILKFFGFLDPIEFNRTTNKYKDVVFLYDEYKQYVRSVIHPYQLQLQTRILPYLCAYCRDSCYYTYPLCQMCMINNWQLSLSWDDENSSFIYTYIGNKCLEPTYTFPDAFQKGLTSKTRFAEDFPILSGSNIGNLPVSETYCFSFMNYKSILLTMPKSVSKFNVELYFDGKLGWLQTTEKIEPGTQLTLNAVDCCISSLLVLDVDEYAVRDVVEPSDDSEGNEDNDENVYVPSHFDLLFNLHQPTNNGPADVLVEDDEQDNQSLCSDEGYTSVSSVRTTDEFVVNNY